MSETFWHFVSTWELLIEQAILVPNSMERICIYGRALQCTATNNFWKCAVLIFKRRSIDTNASGSNQYDANGSSLTSQNNSVLSYFDIFSPSKQSDKSIHHVYDIHALKQLNAATVVSMLLMIYRTYDRSSMFVLPKFMHHILILIRSFAVLFKSKYDVTNSQHIRCSNRNKHLASPFYNSVRFLTQGRYPNLILIMFELIYLGHICH